VKFVINLVIPGCAAWRRPGIHIPCCRVRAKRRRRGYGFRVQPCGLPRNDELSSHRIHDAKANEMMKKMLKQGQELLDRQKQK
jgi:hypothetical protein